MAENRHIIVYDFESYWHSCDYTLSKMSAIDYVRDPRFYAQLLAVSLDGKPPIVVEHDQIPDCLRAMRLDNPRTILIGHNAAGFDNLILSEVYGIHPKCILTDTMHLARWAGLSRICKESLAALSEAVQIGQKGTGTVTSDGKKTKEEFTPDEWEAFKAYCANDVALTGALMHKLLPYMTRGAIIFSSITCKMATDPAFHVDTAILQTYLQELAESEKKAKESLMSILGLADDTDFLKSIRSAKTFSGLLHMLGVDPPMKASAKQTETRRKRLEEDCKNLSGIRREQAEAMLADPASYTVYVPALSKQDVEFVAMLDHPNPAVRELVKLRLDNNSSVPMTRAKALLHMGEYNKPIPILLKCFHAHTSRYGAGNVEGKSDSLNWQNMSKHKPNMKPIRKSIIPPEGYLVVACDSSQIEARVLAYVAQQLDLLEQFATHRDPYAEMASKFGTTATPQEIHDGAKAGNAEMKKLRNAGKKAILSAGYAVGASRFGTSLWIEGVKFADDKDSHDLIAKNYHTIYRQNVPNIVAFWSTCKHVIDLLAAGDVGKFGGPNNDLYEFGPMDMPGKDAVPSIKLPSGFVLRYPNLRYDDKNNMYCYDRLLGKNIVATKIYGGALTENLVQSLAFQILMYQAVRMHEQGISIVCNIHDSFATIVPDAEAQKAADTMLACMRIVPPWVEGLPIDAEVEIGKDFTIV